MTDYQIPESLRPLLTSVEGLTPHPENARVGDLEAIKESIASNGVYRPIQVQRSTGHVLAGNHTFAALSALGATEVPVVYLDVSDTEARRIMLADNRTAQRGGYDDGALSSLLKATAKDKAGVAGTGYAEGDLASLIVETSGGGSTADAPAVPETDVPSLLEGLIGDPLAFLERPHGIEPSTVLDARMGAWRARKVAWMGTGIRSGEGRSDALVMAAHSARDPQFYAKKRAVEARIGRPISTEEFLEKHWEEPEDVGTLASSGTSVFDPVLAEVSYSWYCPPGGRILDPFAGGSVRGVVAALLGYDYTGIDLSADQVEANRGQADRICPAEKQPTWINADSAALLAKPDEVTGPFDLVFSCPPYADLERYSDDPDDLSNKPYGEFLDLYRAIIAGACSRLADDAYAVWVVGDVRDKKTGIYRGLTPDTIEAFEDAGLRLLSDAALATPLGSLPVLAGRQFRGSRKFAKAHQNVLVFVKGDAEKAAARLGNEATTTPDVPPVLTEVEVADGRRFTIVRDDLLPGGSKRRALEAIVPADATELVYPTPAEGMAQVAIAHACAGSQRRAVLFTAARKVLHERTREAARLGAEIKHPQGPGYLSNVRAAAEAYVAATPGAFLVPFGLDVPEARDALASAALSTGLDPSEVWCAAGSGTLTRSLQKAWPNAKHHAVKVGKESEVGEAEPHRSSLAFSQDAKVLPPFPSCSNYDAKIWEFVLAHAADGAVIWNVAR